MDDKQIRGMISHYVGHHLLYARISIESSDEVGARKIGEGLVKSLGELGEAEIVGQVIELANEVDWTDRDSLEDFQKDYINVMYGKDKNASGY